MSDVVTGLINESGTSVTRSCRWPGFIPSAMLLADNAVKLAAAYKRGISRKLTKAMIFNTWGRKNTVKSLIDNYQNVRKSPVRR